MIILKILKILLLSVLGLTGLALLLLCVPVVVYIRFASVSGEFGLTVKYLFVPLRLLPDDERSVIYKLKRLKELAGARKKARGEKRARRRVRLRNFMLKRRATRAVYGFFVRLKSRLADIGRAKKKRKAKKKPSGAQPQKKKEKSAFARLLEERGISGMISWILEIARIAGGMMRRTLRGIIIRRLDLAMDIGGEDAAQTAINYGRLCAVLLPALSLILNEVRRYHRRICLRPDFSDGRIKAELDAELVIFPIAVLGHALMALLRIIAGEVKRRIREKMAEAQSGSGRQAAPDSK